MTRMHPAMRATAVALLLLVLQVSAHVVRHLRYEAQPRPTPAHSVPHDLAEKDDAQLEHVQVHVMERCCPYQSYYTMGSYPSAMETQGWVPALTFHAFKYEQSQRDCWQIVRAADPQGESHLLKEVRPFVQQAIGPVPVNSTFCLSPGSRLDDRRFSIYYVESTDRRASFITQPVQHNASAIAHSFRLSGWPAPSPSTLVKSIQPLAYYFWRELSPPRLVTGLQVHEKRRNSSNTRLCTQGYEALPGDLSFNTSEANRTYACVRYLEDNDLNPILNQTNKSSRYVTNARLIPPSSIKTSRGSGACAEDSELKDSENGSGSYDDDDDDDDASDSGSSSSDNSSNQTQTRLKPVAVCLSKQPILHLDGRARPPHSFVSSISVNESAPQWHEKLTLLFHANTSSIAKQSPRKFPQLTTRDDEY